MRNSTLLNILVGILSVGVMSFNTNAFANEKADAKKAEQTAKAAAKKAEQTAKAAAKKAEQTSKAAARKAHQGTETEMNQIRSRLSKIKLQKPFSGNIYGALNSYQSPAVVSSISKMNAEQATSFAKEVRRLAELNLVRLDYKINVEKFKHARQIRYARDWSKFLGEVAVLADERAAAAAVVAPAATPAPEKKEEVKQ